MTLHRISQNNSDPENTKDNCATNATSSPIPSFPLSHPESALPIQTDPLFPSRQKLNLRRNSHLHAASMYSTNTQAVPCPLLNQRVQIINANVVYNALEHSFHRLESISARFVASHTNGLPTAFSPPRALQNEEKRIGVKPFPSWGNSVTVPKNDHSRRECTSIDSIHH